MEVNIEIYKNSRNSTYISSNAS